MPLITEKQPQRFRELDLLRTLAIVMMVVYHTAFDLASLYNFNIDPYHGWWWLLARSTATLFLLLVGVSFVISWERATSCSGSSRTSAAVISKYLKRGLFIFGCGMIVTAVTYVWEPQTYVRFGILHMIGVSVILLPLFRRFREWNMLIAALIIYLGVTVIPNSKFFILNSELFLPFGITPPTFTTLDYYPLLPWFGVVLLGLALGDFFYIRKERTPQKANRFFQFASFPGRHALIIYLMHQPLLVLILSILFSIR